GLAVAREERHRGEPRLELLVVGPLAEPLDRPFVGRRGRAEERLAEEARQLLGLVLAEAAQALGEDVRALVGAVLDRRGQERELSGAVRFLEAADDAGVGAVAGEDEAEEPGPVGRTDAVVLRLRLEPGRVVARGLGDGAVDLARRARVAERL